MFSKAFRSGSNRHPSNESRVPLQEASHPRPGESSTYGIQSVSESDWGSDSMESTRSNHRGDSSIPASPESQQVDKEDKEDKQDVPPVIAEGNDDGHSSTPIRDLQEALEGSVLPQAKSHLSQGDEIPTTTKTITTPLPPPLASPNIVNTQDLETVSLLLPSPSVIPPSPDDTIHPLSPAPQTPPRPSPSSITHRTTTTFLDPGSPLDYYNYSSDADIDDDTSSLALSLTDLHDFHSLGGDLQSTPSSPASMTSMPSYVASITSSGMSLSRASSPLGSSRHNSGSGRSRRGQASHPGRAFASARDSGGVGLASLVSGNGSGSGGNSLGMGIDMSMSMSGSGDLVLPTLSLPSSSLHLSLRKWIGEAGGSTRVAVLGEREEMKRVIRVLGEREEVVEVGKGQVGVVRDGKVEVLLMTGLTIEQVKARVAASYSLAKRDQETAKSGNEEDTQPRFVGTDNADWVHAALVFGNDTALVQSLTNLTPVIAPRYTGEGVFIVPPITTSAQATSPAHLDDPTPMQRVESSNYFAETHSGHSSGSTQSDIYVDTIISIISNREAILKESQAKFLAWKPSEPNTAQISGLNSPTPSPSLPGSGAPGTASPASHGLAWTANPVPTISRTSIGGGEWEANLSRRIAKRRESDEHKARVQRAAFRDRNRGSTAGPILGSGGGTGRRRSSGGKRAVAGAEERGGVGEGVGGCWDNPLFPPGSTVNHSPLGRNSGCGSAPSSVGLQDLLEKTFKPVRDVVRSRWGKFVIVLAVAVGVGYWASRR